MPPAAYFSGAGKVGKSAPGRPRPPCFLQLAPRYLAAQQPLNVCKACGPVVTGAEGVRLRLTAVVLRDVSCFKDRSRSTSRGRRQYETIKQINLSLQKAVRRSGTRSPPQISSQEDFAPSVAAHWPSLGVSDWTKNGGLGSPQRLLVTFGCPKVIRGPGPGRPRRTAPKVRCPPDGKKKRAGGYTASSFNTSLLTSLLAQTAQRWVMGRGPPSRVDTWPPASVTMRLPAA